MPTTWKPIQKGLTIFALLLCLGCQEEILHGLSELDANRLYAALDQSGIKAEKFAEADGKFVLAVDSDQVISALRVIDHSRIVKTETTRPKSKSPLISGRAEERFQFERNLSAELEQTVSSIRGVLESRVHINLPPTDALLGLPKSKEGGSASVLIVTEDESVVDSVSIAKLIGGAAGINPESVSVMTTHVSTQITPPKLEGTVGHSQTDWLKLPVSDRGKYYLVIALILACLGSIQLQRVLRKRSIAQTLAQKFAV